MFSIRSERPDDAAAIETLLDVAFGPGRFAKTAYRLREGVTPLDALSYVAEENGTIIGTIRYWPVQIGGKPSLMLGPIAVRSEQRGRGIAVKLMQISLEQAASLGHGSCILVGDEPYYARVGFSRVPKGSMTMPGPVDYSRLLWLELMAGGLEGLSGAITKAL